MLRPTLEAAARDGWRPLFFGIVPDHAEPYGTGPYHTGMGGGNVPLAQIHKTKTPQRLSLATLATPSGPGAWTDMDIFFQ